MSSSNYIGSELALFAAARNWKDYWASYVRPFIAGDVLEVGAGIGSNTPLLDCATGGSPSIRHWVCLEPDAALLVQVPIRRPGSSGRSYEMVSGTLQTLDEARKFDTVIYIDVLEHIERDQEELKAAAARLHHGGRIIVLAPAHQWLFTPFDAAIGHFRRYDRSMLRAISPPGVELEEMIYLDSAGLAASTANRLLLRQSMPTKGQLQIWDRWLIPISRALDPIFRNSVGKSVLAVWRKP